MGDAAEFTIGARASCRDGLAGLVSQVVVDPVAGVITHLVVEPEGRVGLSLDCTLAEFERLEPAEQTQFIPGSGGYRDYGPEQVLAWPYYGLGGSGVEGDTVEAPSETVTYDSIPAGEVAFRRGMAVHAADGQIGQVEGLVLNRRDGRVTHVLLQEGHLWGRKEVAIPVSAVTEVADGIRLGLTRHEVRDLPPVDISRLDA
jgi:sporulation protein YlmC with PRC-barrel domain